MVAEHEVGVRALLDQIVAALDDPGRVARLTSDSVRAAEIVAALGPIATAGEPTITWTGVNDRRVDVGIEADGREWRVVLSIDEVGVHSATAIERPPLFPGVPGGRAVILNGPSSAGKSTVMTAMVEQSPTPWVMFDELWLGTVPSPFLVFRAAAPTLVPGFVSGIAALAAAGNQVVLSAAGFGYGAFEELMDRIPTVRVGLDCPLEERVRRQSGRPGRWGGLTEGSAHIHDGWTYDLRFDTGARRAPSIAEEVLAAAAALPGAANTPAS